MLKLLNHFHLKLQKMDFQDVKLIKFILNYMIQSNIVKNIMLNQFKFVLLLEDLQQFLIKKLQLNYVKLHVNKLDQQLILAVVKLYVKDLRMMKVMMMKMHQYLNNKVIMITKMVMLIHVRELKKVKKLLVIPMKKKSKLMIKNVMMTMTVIMIPIFKMMTNVIANMLNNLVKL